MSNEARMSIKLLASQHGAPSEPAGGGGGGGGGDNILGPNRGSVKQASMEEILMKAQRMYQMTKNEQVEEV